MRGNRKTKSEFGKRGRKKAEAAKQERKLYEIRLEKEGALILSADDGGKRTKERLDVKLDKDKLDNALLRQTNNQQIEELTAMVKELSAEVKRLSIELNDLRAVTVEFRDKNRDGESQP